jgi:hypothetical protein
MLRTLVAVFLVVVTLQWGCFRSLIYSVHTDQLAAFDESKKPVQVVTTREGKKVSVFKGIMKAYVYVGSQETRLRTYEFKVEKNQLLVPKKEAIALSKIDALEVVRQDLVLWQTLLFVGGVLAFTVLHGKAMKALGLDGGGATESP